jgi:hypothetical protein
MSTLGHHRRLIAARRCYLVDMTAFSAAYRPNSEMSVRGSSSARCQNWCTEARQSASKFQTVNFSQQKSRL